MYEIYRRDIIWCIRALFGDPAFAQHLIFSPERHYTDQSKTTRIYHEMHTGQWWWETQASTIQSADICRHLFHVKKLLERRNPGATIVPLIVSTDKTQVTQFRNKAAYPVYLTIGNIPKSIRRKPSRHAHILIAYLPTTKLEHITNKAARRRTTANLYHSCMGRIFSPLVRPGLHGVIMSSGDGVRRRCHPIYAAHVADYQDQTLATGVKNGECPKCDTPHDQLGAHHNVLHLRNLNEILSALALADSDPTRFARACVDAGIKPIYHPFWAILPFLNIFESITPDILHQIFQGNLRHLINWLKTIFGAAELDARCERLPPNHNVRHFFNGICELSKVTGKEHDEMCRILLGILVDLPLPNNATNRVIRAVRAMLDFFYMAQYPVHTSDTLTSLDDALDRFHTYKDVFVDLGVRDSFNIPKLHSLRHYSRSIKLFGTTDNYNTQATERLHIDYAKDAYRATNKKDEYPQMTLWLERREKIHRHADFVSWRLNNNHTSETTPQTPALELERYAKLPKHPTINSVSLESLVTDYGATYIREALARYIVATNHPDWNSRRVEEAALDTFLPFRALPVYHKVKFLGKLDGTLAIADAIHAYPTCKRKRKNRTVAARFDTGIVNVDGGGKIGVKGTVARTSQPTVSYPRS